MPDLIIEVENEKDIHFKKWIVYELAFSEVKLVFKDVESGETVEYIWWYEEEGFCPLPIDRSIQ